MATDDFEIKAQVIDRASNVVEPVSGKTLLDAHVLEEVEVEKGKVHAKLLFPQGYDKSKRWEVEDALADAVKTIEGVVDVAVSSFFEGYTAPTEAPAPSGAQDPPPAATAAAIEATATPAATPSAPPPAGKAGNPVALRGVGRVIAVASGKGGVGKSTVAVNLALGLRHLGFSVGLLDIDVYGPSLPTLLGINDRPSVQDKRIVPLEAQGLKLMSLGFLMDDDTPVIWRGPIVTGIIRQFLQDVDWAGVDYLVVDLPPGTGDAQLSLAQTVPVDGAIVVTTPSDLSLIDAARGLRMFKTLNVDVLGIVENMSYFIWPGAAAVEAAVAQLERAGADPGVLAAITGAITEFGRMHIFGSGGGRTEAERLETAFLGEIPLDAAVRAGGDRGNPIVAADPTGPVGQAFIALAQRVTELKPLGEGGTQKKGIFSFLKS